MQRRKHLFSCVRALCDAGRGHVTLGAFYDQCAAFGQLSKERGQGTSYGEFPAKERFEKYLRLVKPDDSSSDAIEENKLTYEFRRNKKRANELDKRFYNAMAIVSRSLIPLSSKPIREKWRETIDGFFAKVDQDRRTAAKSAASLQIAAVLFGQEHNLDDGPIEVATRRFFGAGHKAGDRLYYETYRFSVDPGKIDKSFTVISAPRPEFNATDFINFFPPAFGTATPRRTVGIAVGLQRATYLMGPSNALEAMKFIALPPFDQTASEIAGGTISTDPDGAIVMGKVLMVKSKVPSSLKLEESGQAPIGTHALSDLAGELTVRQLNLLRNRSDMKIEGDLREWRDGAYESVPQEKMVKLTHELLKKACDGHELFRVMTPQNSAGTPFNPADKKSYTFNGAIQIGPRD